MNGGRCLGLPQQPPRGRGRAPAAAFTLIPLPRLSVASGGKAHSTTGSSQLHNRVFTQFTRSEWCGAASAELNNLHAAAVELPPWHSRGFLWRGSRLRPAAESPRRRAARLHNLCCSREPLTTHSLSHPGMPLRARWHPTQLRRKARPASKLAASAAGGTGLADERTSAGPCPLRCSTRRLHSSHCSHLAPLCPAAAGPCPLRPLC